MAQQITVGRDIVRQCMASNLAGLARQYAEEHEDEYAAFLEEWKRKKAEAEAVSNGKTKNV